MSTESSQKTKLSLNITRTGNESSSFSLDVVQGFLGAISVVAFLGNGLVCLVILRNRNILKFPYNKFLFSLAITDMLTGICMIATPTLVIDDDLFPVLTGFTGELFCRLVTSQYFVYALGKVSVFTTAGMSLERWYSILSPLQYILKFKNNRIHCFLAAIWLLGFACVGFVPFGRVFVNNQCHWTWAPFHRELLIILYVFFTFLTPSAVACSTILHIYFVIKRSRLRKTGNANAIAKRKLLRMCAIVVFLLTFCWLPNQLYYSLSAYKITTLETSFHYFTIVLAMSNSCINPWVYCFANRQIKAGILSLLNPIINILRKRRISQENWRNIEGRMGKLDGEKG